MFPRRLALTTRSLPGVLVLSLSAAAASAEPFTATLVDAGGNPGSLGSAIYPSSGTFYQSAPGDNYPPSTELISLFDYVIYDSYVALGGAPSNPFFKATPPLLAIDAGASTGLFYPDTGDFSYSLSGVWVSPPVIIAGDPDLPDDFQPATSVPGPFGDDCVFIARLTVSAGARPQSGQVIFGVKTGAGTGALVRAAIDGTAEISTISGGVSGKWKKSSRFLLKAHLSAREHIPGFGPADVFDLYIVSEPTIVPDEPAPLPERPLTRGIVNDPAPAPEANGSVAIGDFSRVIPVQKSKSAKKAKQPVAKRATAVKPIKLIGARPSAAETRRAAELMQDLGG